MALDAKSAQLDLTGAVIHQYVAEQSWFKKNANTVTTAAGFVATVVAWLASQPFAASPGWQMGILIVGFLATVLGVKTTKNGFSESQLDKINAAQAQFIGETPLVVEPEESVEDEQTRLEGLISDFNEARRI